MKDYRNTNLNTNREDTSNYGTDIGDKMRKRLGIFSNQNLISEVQQKSVRNKWEIKSRENTMNTLPVQ